MRRGRPDECWPWVGAVGGKGYGRFWFWGRLHLATHWAWIEQFGPISDGLLVLHHCDNPPCVNPAHLYLGTHAMNVADMDQRGRRVNAPKRGADHYLNVHPELRRQGQDVGNAKLTNDQARQIRDLLVEGRPPALIARQYGVSISTIHLIEVGRRYAIPEAGWLG